MVVFWHSLLHRVYSWLSTIKFSLPSPCEYCCTIHCYSAQATGSSRSFFFGFRKAAGPGWEAGIFLLKKCFSAGAEPPFCQVFLSGPWLVLLEQVFPAGKGPLFCPALLFNQQVPSDAFDTASSISPFSGQVIISNLFHPQPHPNIQPISVTPEWSTQIECSEWEIVGIIKRLWARDFPIPEPNVRHTANDTTAQEMSPPLVSSPDCVHQKMIVVNKSLKQQRFWHSPGFP